MLTSVRRARSKGVKGRRRESLRKTVEYMKQKGPSDLHEHVMLLLVATDRLPNPTRHNLHEHVILLPKDMGFMAVVPSG